MMILREIINKILILAIILFFSFSSYSQSILITGKVINEKKDAIERVQVLLRYINGGTIVAFVLTSETGDFELKKDLQDVHPDSLELYFSYMGYAPQTFRVPRNNQPMLVELVVKDIILKEVVVNAPKIWLRRDTITYVVSSFSSAEDRTIGDVLKKMPGIEVQESGKITYQGKELNKFYIEGSDMLEGRYGLATQNISYKDVAVVEVMENHQPIKALEDVVFSDSPAMNIKLKEDAKIRWAGTIKGGGGIPGLWIAEVFAMRFKLKTQTLNTYKGNNTGNESFELNIFTPLSDFSSYTTTYLPNYIQVSPSTANDIGSSRSTFNQTNNITSNNLIKIRKDLDLTSEFTGSFDRRESEFVSETVYFLGDEHVSIEDKTEKANNFKKSFTGKIRLKSNQPNYYFNNHLNFSYDRNDPFIDILGSYPNSQTACIENLKISNDFDILKRYNEKFFSISSSNEFISKPQSLEVTKNGMPPIHENISFSTFNSNNSTEYSFLVGNIRIRTPIRLQYQYRNIANDSDTETNRLNTHKLRLDLTPSTEYNIHDFLFNLSLPLYYQSLSLENRTHHFYRANPRFLVRWIASAMLKIGASINYSNELPDESLFYNGQIMNNYRSLTTGYIDFSTGKSAGISANMEYKNVTTSFFADLSISLSKRRSTKINGQDFIDDYIVNYYYSGHQTSEMLLVYGSLSKGVEWINGFVALYPLFVRSSSSIERNGLTIPFASESYSLRSTINSRLSSHCDLTYLFSYGHYRNLMDEANRQYFASTRLSESLKVTFIPLKSLQMSFKFDHYCNELSVDSYKNFFFSDVSVSYLLGSRWEFAISVKNLFDERYYSYFIENELTSFYKSYTIRPRNVLLFVNYRF